MYKFFLQCNFYNVLSSFNVLAADFYETKNKVSTHVDMNANNNLLRYG